jgi:hypothetical protein
MNIQNPTYSLSWKYINGSEGSDTSVQISPGEKFVLIKEYDSTKEGVKKTFRIEGIKSIYNKIHHDK